MRKKFVFIFGIFVCCIGIIIYYTFSIIQKYELEKRKKEVWTWINVSSWNIILEDWNTTNSFSWYTNDRDSAQRFTYPFISVVDGDTIKIFFEWETHSVRLIGVDTPEKYSTRYGYAECFWEEASQHLKDLLHWITEVEIEYDDSQGTYDKYWRILWYLFVHGENYNQKMIEDWYAREYTYKTPYHYQKDFQYAQKQAELWNRWLWDVHTCNGERKSI